MSPYVNPNQAVAFNDGAFVQVWYELQRRLFSAIGNAATKIVGVCFVGPDGDDASAEPDSLTKKYATVQAAVTAALAGGRTVCLCPGIYSESVQLPPTFSTLAMISLLNKAATIYSPTDDVPALRYTAGTGGFARLLLVDLNFGADIADVNLATILIDAGAVSTDGEVTLSGCNVVNEDVCPALRCDRVNKVSAEYCEFSTGLDAVTLLQCASGEFLLCKINGRFADGFDSAGAVPPSPREDVTLSRCSITQIVVSAEARVSVEYSHVRRMTLAALNDTNGPHGQLNFSWCELDDVNFLCTFASEQWCSLSHHNKHHGSLGITQAIGGVLAKAQFRQDDFETSGFVASGTDCLIDILGSTFNQANLTGVGGIDRDWHSLGSVAVPVGPVGAPAVSPPWAILPPFGITPYDVVWNGLAGAGPSGTVVEYQAKLATGFVTSAVSPSTAVPTLHTGDLRIVARTI